MTQPLDIRPDHLQIVKNILREHLPEDIKVWIFGSRSDWTTKDSSDLDIALEGNSALDSQCMSTVEDAFEDSDLPYTVDIVDINNVSDDFRQIIDFQKVPLQISDRRNVKEERDDYKLKEPLDISPDDLTTVRKILAEHVPDLEVKAFGSRASWTARQYSDLDLVLMTDEPLDVSRMASLREAFIESNLPYIVDIVDWASA
ncbi:MAG: nucleotidyltransferase domain-containing protein, partial [Candidatus Dadabacteria bacterium]|nr:nucleotidyltransferase domain-containing protein [Candidatus Dadabacteria bacterium]